MVLTINDIKKVLALYDGEDIPYVLSDLLLQMMVSRDEGKSNDYTKKVKIKTKVDQNNRIEK